MKRWGILAVASLLITACGSERNMSSYKGKQIQLVNDEPDYMKDRRLEEYTKDKTHSHGTMGPGSGGSYGSYSYRQSAIKAKKDTLAGTTGKIGEENQPETGLATDTTDTGEIW